MKVNLISLGCPKNLVDSEVILGRLGERGYSLTSLPEEAEVLTMEKIIRPLYDTRLKQGEICDRFFVYVSILCHKE
ncbi:hypothetical protein KAU05_03865, partial [Candidatus Aerophobetes bacterium]|nr:hypothetical protein [Candidatus Aerophobetes bacterium]